MKIEVTVTDELVERACHVLAMNDWLPHNWDYKGPDICECCKQLITSYDNDAGEQTRKAVRNILIEILSDEPLNMSGYRDEEDILLTD